MLVDPVAEKAKARDRAGRGIDRAIRVREDRSARLERLERALQGRLTAADRELRGAAARDVDRYGPQSRGRLQRMV